MKECHSSLIIFITVVKLNEHRELNVKNSNVYLSYFIRSIFDSQGEILHIFSIPNIVTPQRKEKKRKGKERKGKERKENKLNGCPS